jgi:hypothetical protein
MLAARESGMRRPRTAPPLLLLFALLVGGGARDARGEGAPVAPKAAIDKVEKLALDLAKKGRADEVDDVLEVLVRLGPPAAEVGKVREAARKALGPTKPAPAPELAPAAKAAAADLVAALDAADEGGRVRLAEAAVLLDSGSAKAQEALGRVLVDGTWGPKGLPEIVKRRAAIADALRQARRLEVPVEKGISDIAAFQDLYGKPGHFVQWDEFSLHSVKLSPEKLERMLKATVRAISLSNYVRTGTLALPLHIHPIKVMALGSREDYKRAVAEAVAHGGMQAKDKEWYLSIESFEDERKYLASSAAEEIYEEATYAYWVYRRQSWALVSAQGQPCLDAGHLNWVCQSFLGITAPQPAVHEVKEKVIDEDTTAGRARATERQEIRRIAEAGIAGTHAWMVWLASHHEDPPWTAAMLPQQGDIGGEPLLKATIVAEYLHETGEFAKLWEATLPGKVEEGTKTPEVMAKALGQDLAQFEARWREWLLPARAGVAQRLVAPPPPPPDPATRRVLARLDALRKTAGGKQKYAGEIRPLASEPSLSKGCLLHARYLGKHPDQLSKWPDAHEEFSDREPFTPEGCFAGLHSVIDPSADSPEAAIDHWMGTFYHRLPLLDPGLIRVGWGLEGKIAVLDVGSMVDAGFRFPLVIAWPADGATDVPARFTPELPNPVPGEVQAKWGTCVTVQVFGYVPMPSLVVRLYEGSPVASHEVACHVSTPSKPSNPELPTPGAWALMPKAALTPKTTYTVVAEGFEGGARHEWKFTTGAK